MPKKLNLLSESACDSVESGGRKVSKLHDGGGIYLWVRIVEGSGDSDIG